jgi:YcaO-like protein with predicted kinase domain
LPVAQITRVADVTWLDDLGIPTAQAIRPASLTLTVSQGKGATIDAARVSAAMEALELWHAEHVPPDRVAISPAELADELTYDPATLPLAVESLYHPHAEMAWVRGTALHSGRQTWLPRSAVLLDATADDRYQPPLFESSSNGLASGNTLAEATLHGLYELLERDALARASAQGAARWLNLATVDDPHCCRLIKCMGVRDNRLSVLDVTADEQLPTYWAQLSSSGLSASFAGSGAHLDPAVALSRALTEAAQSRLTAIAGSRDDLPASVYRALGQPWVDATDQQDSLADAEETVAFTRRHDGATGRLGDDLDRVLGIVLSATGVEPVAARLRRPGCDLAVVRVHAPGLLYDPTIDNRAPRLRRS